MKKIILSCLALGLMLNSVVAQNDLVENGSFEDTKGKIKKAGAINLAVGWISPTKTGADLYSDKIPEKLGVPDNFNGKEDAYDGSNYAGFSAFSYGNKEPRTYVSSRLALPMRKGQKYCVKFYVSLSESSKYGCNNIAANFSKKQYNMDVDKNIVAESHVTQTHNEVFDELFGWSEVCGTYIAEGGERFLTIGNFETNGNTENVRIKKPSSFKGSQGIRAYYYLDNISVELIEDENDCACETDADTKTSFVYDVSPVNLEDMDLDQALRYTVVYFGYNASEVSLNAEGHLNNIVTIMNQNPGKRIRLNVHTDSDEVTDKKAMDVETRRADAVVAYLTSKGISNSRISVVKSGDSTPKDSSGSEIGNAKNRRVTFTLL